MDIDQPTSFTREFKEIISPSTLAIILKFQNAATSGEESKANNVQKSRLPAQSNRLSVMSVLHPLRRFLNGK